MTLFYLNLLEQNILYGHPMQLQFRLKHTNKILISGRYVPRAYVSRQATLTIAKGLTLKLPIGAWLSQR